MFWGIFLAFFLFFRGGVGKDDPVQKINQKRKKKCYH